MGAIGELGEISDLQDKGLRWANKDVIPYFSTSSRAPEMHGTSPESVSAAFLPFSPPHHSSTATTPLLADSLVFGLWSCAKLAALARCSTCPACRPGAVQRTSRMSGCYRTEILTFLQFATGSCPRDEGLRTLGLNKSEKMSDGFAMKILSSALKISLGIFQNFQKGSNGPHTYYYQFRMKGIGKISVDTITRWSWVQVGREVFS